MIQITTIPQLKEYLKDYQTIDEAANESGFSTRTIYRMTYTMDDVLTVKICIPGHRRRQIRLIPRRFRAADAWDEGMKRRPLGLEYLGILPGDTELEDLAAEHDP